MAESAHDEPPPDEPLGDCVGDLTLDEVALDQLRQAVLEQAGRVDRIPALLSALAGTDWTVWLGESGRHVVVCAGCRRYVRRAETVALFELPWLGDSLYCFECAETALAEHTFTCDVCGHDFHARRQPQPFPVCPECDSPAVNLALSSLWAQLQRARKLDLPATLTPREWLDTLDYFGWRCAYCMRAEFACLDHYVPVVQGGGTTRANCVPACTSCNSAKGGRAPQGYVIKASAYTRVEEYLAQFAA